MSYEIARADAGLGNRADAVARARREADALLRR
jgi:hypothetical protein